MSALCSECGNAADGAADVDNVSNDLRALLQRRLKVLERACQPLERLAKERDELRALLERDLRGDA